MKKRDLFNQSKRRMRGDLIKHLIYLKDSITSTQKITLQSIDQKQENENF